MTNICKRYDDFISNLFIFMPTFIQKGWDVCLRLCRPFHPKDGSFSIGNKQLPSCPLIPYSFTFDMPFWQKT